MKRNVLLVILAVLVLGAGFVTIRFYSYVFAKTARGPIVGVERVSPQMLMGGKDLTPQQMFSFAVAVRHEDGNIYSASTEDRQWAVAQKGLCAEARFYPYPPWKLDKAGTYFNARLIRMYDCPPGMTGAHTAGVQVPPPVAIESGVIQAGVPPPATENTQDLQPAGLGSPATGSAVPRLPPPLPLEAPPNPEPPPSGPANAP